LARQYPIENEYSSYLASHSGYSNAYTAATQTNYFFECAASNESNDKLTNGTKETLNGAEISEAARGPFWGALDRFAQFFIEPLFLASTLDRELRAVDSENKKNLQSDVWRLSQLGKSLSNPRHPYHHFSTGNLQTLRDEPEKRGIEVRQKFMEFYERHYSANRMKLVVLGREHLDELETWVSELFSEVKNKDLPVNRWDDVQPLTKNEISTQIFAKPVMESRSLEISFPFQDEEDMFETQPSRYISHLIGHEGPGSILSYIKGKGWAQSLSAGASPVCPGSAFFEIGIRLTPEGLKNYREVVKTVFQYISMMRENPPLEWMFEEQKNMADVEFKFKQKSPASRFTSRVSAVMQKPLPRNWLLSGTSKLRRFDPKGVVQAVQFLRDDNFRLMIVSQDYPIEPDQKEKWYGTEYRIEKIPTDFQSEIRKALESSSSERPAELHLPHKNEFIPTRLNVEKKEEVAEPAKTPKLIRNDDTLRLWWKKDDTFWVPKANVHITLRNPLTYATPANYVKSVLICQLVKDSLTEFSYDAEISGLEYSLTATVLGLDISVQGYNDKLSVLLQKVLVSLKDLKISPERFKIIKERQSRSYKNWNFQQPYYQVGDFNRWLLSARAWMNHQYAAELPHIELDEVQAFISQLLQQTHIEILAHGNFYKEDALKVADLAESVLKPRPLPPSLWNLRRNLILPPGSNYIFQHTLADPANVNHAIEYYLQVGSGTDRKLRAMVGLFSQMTSEPAFDQLRTKEQLGYIVFSGSRTSSTMIGYMVLVQSERTPDYLESRVNAFLLKFGKDLEKMATEEFESHKRSLINKRLEKLKNLESETGRFWGHIGSEYFDFYQIDNEVSILRQLTRPDMESFYRRYISPESSTRAKLSLHMVAKASPPETPEISPKEQKDQLLELLFQYLSSTGLDLDPDHFKQHFVEVDVSGGDEETILSALRNSIGDRLPVQKAEPILEEARKNLETLLVALKIKLPAEEKEINGTDVAKKSPSPIVIEDVDTWKASMTVSEGPRPIHDLSQFEDFEPKL
jgi:insulysin